MTAVSAQWYTIAQCLCKFSSIPLAAGILAVQKQFKLLVWFPHTPTFLKFST